MSDLFLPYVAKSFSHGPRFRWSISEEEVRESEVAEDRESWLPVHMRFFVASAHENIMILGNGCTVYVASRLRGSMRCAFHCLSSWHEVTLFTGRFRYGIQVGHATFLPACLFRE